VRITFFGVRGSCPCSSDQYRRYGGNTSCVLVEVEGEQPLILDLGTGLRALGGYLHAPLQVSGTPLQATVLLTHLHYDHVLGLPFFSPMRDPGAVLDVYGPSQTSGPLRDVLAGMVQPPFFPISMDEFRGDLRGHDLDGPVDFAVGGIQVKARTVHHIGHTLGFRIEADGRSMAYISDHQAPLDRRTVDKPVLELCEGADVVLHDAQYTDEEFTTMSDWGHSTHTYAVRVASEAGARRLILFHHDPSHSDDQVDRMLEHARTEAASGDLAEVSAAAEGHTVDLGTA
jgi:phosphoribosyl 1,2-cyclic phosphodiesterase